MLPVGVCVRAFFYDVLNISHFNFERFSIYQLQVVAVVAVFGCSGGCAEGIASLFFCTAL